MLCVVNVKMDSIEILNLINVLQKVIVKMDNIMIINNVNLVCNIA